MWSKPLTHYHDSLATTDCSKFYNDLTHNITDKTIKMHALTLYTWDATILIIRGT